MIYQDPLTNPLPVAALADFQSMPLSARFDEFDNLYILDHNRSRVLVYRRHEVTTYTIGGTIRDAEGEPAGEEGDADLVDQFLAREGAALLVAYVGYVWWLWPA